jgi:quercetin dioxygenase-like cupin family protein
MFVRTPGELEAAGRVMSLVGGLVWSARYLVADDGLGFSYNDTRTPAGMDARLWYRHHWEANYIIAGRGEVTHRETGEVVTLEPGVLFVVGPNDPHRVRVTENLRAICVFSPPLQGDEVHDEQGAYPPSGPIPDTDRRMFVRRANEMRAAGKEISISHGRARTLRVITKADDVGFSLSDVYSVPGVDSTLWYRHHWEANHVLEGSCEVTDLASGQSWELEPGMAYFVGPKDCHRLRSNSDMRLLSIFCPPLEGSEVQDADGSLPPTGAVPPGPAGY